MKVTVVALVFTSIIILGGCSDSNQTVTVTPDTIKPLIHKPRPALVGSQSNSTRTDEEIQSVFVRNQTRLYDVYQRYLKEQPELQGYVHLRITIEQDGSVSNCSIRSTDIPSEALLTDIVDDIKQFDFGAKANAPSTTIVYPIDFRHASSE